VQPEGLYDSGEDSGGSVRHVDAEDGCTGGSDRAGNNVQLSGAQAGARRCCNEALRAHEGHDLSNQRPVHQCDAPSATRYRSWRNCGVEDNVSV
jgi:hypothetical protein